MASKHAEKNLPYLVAAGDAKKGRLRYDHGGSSQLDPGADYTAVQIQFMQAMDRYKRVNHRPFPTWSEVLEVLLSLGYRQVEPPTDLPRAPRRRQASADPVTVIEDPHS